MAIFHCPIWLVLTCMSRMTSTAQTEAEKNNFNISALPLISSEDIEVLRTRLSHPQLGFLGAWRSNSSYLRDMNARLVSGGYHVIEDVFDTVVADKMYKEMKKLAARGKLGIPDYQIRQGGGRPWSTSGIDDEYVEVQTPASRCELFKSNLAKRGYMYQRHESVASKTLEGKFAEKNNPTLMWVGNVLNTQNEWYSALNLLLTGSGMRVEDDMLAHVGTEWGSFVEMMPGDFLSRHNDAVGSRALSITFMLSSPEWKTEWGGNFLWCGASAGGQNVFPHAARVPPRFNSAILFLPHHNTAHVVEPVMRSHASFHRFSFQNWLKVKIPGFDIESHWLALMRRQRSLQDPRRNVEAIIQNRGMSQVFLSYRHQGAEHEFQKRLVQPGKSLIFNAIPGEIWDVRTGPAANSKLLKKIVVASDLQQSFAVKAKKSASGHGEL